MVTDRLRLAAYREALEKSVTPGCVVADIGTGIGIFAVLACQLGARRVYAIEPDPVIAVGREIAEANGVADRIEFIAELSSDISLPEPVDVIVSDLGGVLPMNGEAVGAIIDARDRFLRAGGTLIPARDFVWGALAEARKPNVYDPTALADGHLGVDMRAAEKFAVNQVRRTRLTPEELIVEPQQWVVLDHREVASPDFSGELSWTVSSACRANSLCLWFDKELGEGIGFSNAPGAPKCLYGQAIFPLEAPIELFEGDNVTVAIDVRPVTDGDLWRWRTRVVPADGGAEVQFSQSNLGSAPISLSRLAALSEKTAAENRA